MPASPIGPAGAPAGHAGAYRLPPRIAGELLERSRDLPEAVRATGWKAQVRLCDSYRRMLRAG